jgi:hypothetical protein
MPTTNPSPDLPPVSSISEEADRTDEENSEIQTSSGGLYVVGTQQTVLKYYVFDRPEGFPAN